MNIDIIKELKIVFKDIFSEKSPFKMSSCRQSIIPKQKKYTISNLLYSDQYLSGSDKMVSHTLSASGIINSLDKRVVNHLNAYNSATIPCDC